MTEKRAIATALVAALGAGIAGNVLLLAMNPPFVRADISLIMGLLAIATAYYVAPPLIVLVATALLKVRAIRILSAVLVPSLWLLLVALVWAKKSWLYYGEFPYELVSRYFLPFWPVQLLFGAVFGVVFDRAVASNSAVPADGKGPPRG